MHKQGKTLTEIATERALTVNTIEGHFAHYISTNELNLDDLLSGDKIKTIKDAVKVLDTRIFGELKNYLGSEISYGEIKMVLATLPIADS